MSTLSILLSFPPVLICLSAIRYSAYSHSEHLPFPCYQACLFPGSDTLQLEIYDCCTHRIFLSTVRWLHYVIWNQWCLGLIVTTFQSFGPKRKISVTNAHLFREQGKVRIAGILLMACHILLLCCTCFFCLALRTFNSSSWGYWFHTNEAKNISECPGGEYFYVLLLRWGCFRMMLSSTQYLLHTNQSNNNSGHLISKHVPQCVNLSLLTSTVLLHVAQRDWTKQLDDG